MLYQKVCAERKRLEETICRIESMLKDFPAGKEKLWIFISDTIKADRGNLILL